MPDFDLHKLITSPVYFNSLVLPKMFDTVIPAFHRRIYKPLADPKVKLLIVRMPRGYGKTTVLQGYLMQQVLSLKHPVTVYVGDTFTQAEMHCETVRMELEDNEIITRCFGKQQGRKWTSTQWTTVNGMTVLPKGSNQSIRGVKIGRHRPTLIIIDDPENDENTESLEQRDKLWRHFFAVLKPMMKSSGTGVKIVYLGTPIHEDCVLYRFIDLFTSIRYRNDPSICVVEQGARDEKDNSVWPELWSNERLAEEEQLYADAGQLDVFYREYIGQCISGKDALFQKENACYYEEGDIPSDGTSFTYMSIDVAFSQSHSADFSAVVVYTVNTAAKSLFVREAVRKRMTPDEFLALLSTYNSIYRPGRVFVQGVVLDEFFQFYAHEKDTHLPFRKVKMSRQKNAKRRRIASMVPLYNTHRIRFLKRHVDLLAGLWAEPRPKHDDLGDALATGIAQIRIPGWSPRIVKSRDQYSFEAIMERIRKDKMKSAYGLTHLPSYLDATSRDGTLH